MIMWAGYQPRWAEFEQGRPQKNRLQTFPGRADTLCVLGIHVGPAAKQGQGRSAASPLQASSTTYTEVRVVETSGILQRTACAAGQVPMPCLDQYGIR